MNVARRQDHGDYRNGQEIEIATITVADLKPPPASNRSGKIISEDGVPYSAWPKQWAQFVKGQTYEIEYDSNVKDGVTYRNIVSFRLLAPPDHQSRAQAEPAHVAKTVARAAAAQRPQPAAVKRDSMEPDRYGYPTHPRDAIRMWCCALIQKDMERGNVAFNDEEAVVERVEFWKRVWQRSLNE